MFIFVAYIQMDILEAYFYISQILIASEVLISMYNKWQKTQFYIKIFQLALDSHRYFSKMNTYSHDANII